MPLFGFPHVGVCGSRAGACGSRAGSRWSTSYAFSGTHAVILHRMRGRDYLIAIQFSHRLKRDCDGHGQIHRSIDSPSLRPPPFLTVLHYIFPQRAHESFYLA